MAHTYIPLRPSSSTPPRTPRSRPLSRRLARLGGIIALLTASSLTILSLVAYLSPFRGATRPCLPFSLQRLSTSAHSALACPGRIGVKTMVTSSSTGSGSNGGGGGGSQLEGWLRAQRESFLSDLAQGSLKGWTIVMGNEAGDLDSLSASIAYAYLSTKFQSTRTIPITLTPSTLMHLRPENMLAFKFADGLNADSLVYPDTIPLAGGQTPSPGVFPSTLSFLGNMGATYALVDHNRLLPIFGQGQVDAVIDHHEDEHAHSDAALRLIQVPTGSCSSLIVKHFKDKWETASHTTDEASPEIFSEIATLLLSAILIDTAGLREGGKGTPTDFDAGAFLYPLSKLPATASINDTTPSAAFGDVFESLSAAKADVSALNTRELLLRDYKEYVLPTSSVAYPSLKAGLSTVPVGIKVWLERESDSWKSYMAAVDAYMVERNLDVQGVLTSFNGKSGKHKREILLVARTGNSFKTPEQARNVMNDLIVGFEGSSELSLTDWSGPVKQMLLPRKALDDESQGRFGKVWKQENRRATRKQVAPLLRDLVSKLQ